MTLMDLSNNPFYHLKDLALVEALNSTNLNKDTVIYHLCNTLTHNKIYPQCLQSKYNLNKFIDFVLNRNELTN